MTTKELMDRKTKLEEKKTKLDMMLFILGQEKTWFMERYNKLQDELGKKIDQVYKEIDQIYKDMEALGSE